MIAGTAHTQTTQTHPIPGAPGVMIKLSGEREQAQTSTALAKQKDLRGGDGGGGGGRARYKIDGSQCGVHCNKMNLSAYCV